MYQAPPPATDEEKLAVTPVGKLPVVQLLPPGSLDILLGLASLYNQEQPSVIVGELPNLPVPLFHSSNKGNN